MNNALARNPEEIAQAGAPQAPTFNTGSVPSLYAGGSELINVVTEHRSLVPDFGTKTGYEIARVAISQLKAVRIGVEKRRKELKEGALDFGRAVDAEAQRLTEIVVEVEKPLANAKKEYDDTLKREKARLEAVEADRLSAIKRNIEAWAYLPAELDTSNLDDISAALASVTRELAEVQDCETSEKYGEFTPRAFEVMTAAKARLEDMYSRAKAAQAIALEQEAERERQAAEAANLKAQREAVEVQQREIAEQQKAIDDERARIEREHAEREAEDIRLREEEAAAKELEREVSDAHVEALDIHEQWTKQKAESDAAILADKTKQSIEAAKAALAKKDEVDCLTQWATDQITIFAGLAPEHFDERIDNHDLQTHLNKLTTDIVELFGDFRADINA